MDTWSLDFYLAKTIRDSVLYLKDTTCGYPSDLQSMDEWKEILGKIAWTFDLIIKIIDLDIYYFEADGFESEERYEKAKEAVNSSCRGRVATEEEIQKYKEGFALFQKYFMSLWS
jgi:c-di-GMP-related signal transduction protein